MLHVSMIYIYAESGRRVRVSEWDAGSVHKKGREGGNQEENTCDRSKSYARLPRCLGFTVGIYKDLDSYAI